MMNPEQFMQRYFIRGLAHGDERIWADNLADAQRQADRRQVFPGGRITIEGMDSDEILAIKENGVWVDMGCSSGGEGRSIA